MPSSLKREDVDLTVRKRNRRGEGALLRGELIQAAMRILDRAPATQLSLRMVAREAGIAPPSVYPHFADAQTMMTEIMQECWNQMALAMAAAAEDGCDDNAFSRLARQMTAYVHYAMERPSRYQLLFAMQPVATEDSRQIDGLLRPVYRQVIATLECYCRQGGILPADDLTSSALLIISLAHGRIALAHLAPSRAGNSDASVEDFVQDLLGRILSRETCNA